MRVSVVRDPVLTGRELAAIRSAGLAPLLRGCGDRLGLPARASLAVLLTGDEELRHLNARFLGDDRPTDVLAFPTGEAGRVGDIAISVERALVQNPDGAAELRLLAVHALLHCTGHDHASTSGAERMTAATRELLPEAEVPDLVAAG